MFGLAFIGPVGTHLRTEIRLYAVSLFSSYPGSVRVDVDRAGESHLVSDVLALVGSTR